MHYTVVFDQINRTNFQVVAKTEEEAEEKAEKLYRKYCGIPSCESQEGWILESDGKDK